MINITSGQCINAVEQAFRVVISRVPEDPVRTSQLPSQDALMP